MEERYTTAPDISVKDEIFIEFNNKFAMAKLLNLHHCQNEKEK